MAGNYGFILSNTSVSVGSSLSLTLQKGTDTPLSYNLEYSEGAWLYPADGSVIEAFNYGGDFYILNYNFTSEDESDQYSLNLVSSALNSSFTDAVTQVLENTNVINPVDTLYDDDVSYVDTPISLVFTVPLAPYPMNEWEVSVNGIKLVYNEGFFMGTDPETSNVYIVGYSEGSYFFLVQGENPAGSYALKIQARKKAIDGYIQISNLECNKSFAEIAYLASKHLITGVTNPDGESAITLTITPSSFSATFLTAPGAGSAEAVIYTLDDTDTITTAHYSTNITLTAL